MPLLDNETAIRQYYEQEKHKYPDMPYEQFKEICRSPSNFFKECIKSGRLPRIFVKYLGKFRVFPSRLKDEIRKYKRFFDKGIIDEETFKQDTAWAEYHLNKIKKEINERTTAKAEEQATN